jgi:hypothetical protein
MVDYLLPARLVAAKNMENPSRLPPFRPEPMVSCSIPPRELLKYLLVSTWSF